MSGKPEGYIDVAHRIAAFKEAHPEGSLVRDEWHVERVPVGNEDHSREVKTFIVYTAKAYRTPTDMRPGVGTAWEPYPGPTPFTKDSELMNAETAAWGRAIAALGFEVRQGIATAQDVENRSGEPVKRSNGVDPQTEERGRFNTPSEKQLDLIEKLARENGADNLALLRSYAADNLSGGKGGSASKLIDKLMDKDGDPGQVVLDFGAAAEKWAESETDAPPDKTGLDTSPVES